MAARADSYELSRLGLSPGEARSVELDVPLAPLQSGGQTYSAGAVAAVRLDVSRTISGVALRLRFGVDLGGPCMRCLEDAGAHVAVDAREVDQPDGGEELSSPYLRAGELDVAAWARDALALALPTQIWCSEECRGLCVVCGKNLNADPDHEHEKPADPRWAKLDELKL